MKRMRKDLVDPNTIEVPYKEAYIAEDLERRSPSLDSPRLPPIIDEGNASHAHRSRT